MPTLWGPSPSQLPQLSSFPQNKPSPKRQKTNQNKINNKRIINASNSNKTFSDRKADDSQSYLRIASGHKIPPPLPLPFFKIHICLSLAKIRMLFQPPALSKTYIKNLIEFQKAFDTDVVSAAFTKSLPERCTASTEIDRNHILYQNILKFSKAG